MTVNQKSVRSVKLLVRSCSDLDRNEISYEIVNYRRQDTCYMRFLKRCRNSICK